MNRASTPPGERVAALAVLMLLVVVGSLALRGSAGEARSVISRDLSAAGHDWAHVEVDDGRAHLSGRPPEAGMGGAALDVARASRCRRLLSTGPCVASVAADFGEDAPLERVWPELTVTMLGGVLSVSGLVPDVASKRTVLDAARAAAAARVGVRSVRDELRVGSKASPAGVKPLLKRLTLAVSLCRAGSGTVRNGVTSFECRVDPLLQDSIRSLLATPLPAGDLLALELTATPTNSGDPAS